MLNRLTRKLIVLSVLVAALTAVPSRPASPPTTRGGVFCVDAPIDSECPPGTLVCCNEWGGCWCQ
jgi:hypothetical protein